MPNQFGGKDSYTIEMILQDEAGDRVHCSIPKGDVGVFSTLIKEHGFYAMRNFIVKPVGKSLRTTPHKFKLCFYLRTSVSVLRNEPFLLNPFRFTSFSHITNMANINQGHLTYCVGQIVGKEDTKDIITKTGQSSKRLCLYIEDEEKNKMKCTIFGDFVDQVAGVLQALDAEPLVLVAQLFKPNVYMNEVNVQSNFYGSRLFLNPNYPEVVAYRERLMNQGNGISSQISHVDSYVDRSVSKELTGGSNCITTIEEVFNMTEAMTCWIVAAIVSIDSGHADWCYPSCVACRKKVHEKNNRFVCDSCNKVGANPPWRYLDEYWQAPNIFFSSFFC